MDSSYEEEAEEMGLLTQIPSQQRIAELQGESSEDEEFTGFHLKPAQDLISCSANKERDFSQFVANIVSDGGPDLDSSTSDSVDELLSNSPDLFDEPMLTLSSTSHSDNIQVKYWFH